MRTFNLYPMTSCQIKTFQPVAVLAVLLKTPLHFDNSKWLKKVKGDVGGLVIPIQAIPSVWKPMLFDVILQ